MEPLLTDVMAQERIAIQIDGELVSIFYYPAPDAQKKHKITTDDYIRICAVFADWFNESPVKNYTGKRVERIEGRDVSVKPDTELLSDEEAQMFQQRKMLYTWGIAQGVLDITTHYDAEELDEWLKSARADKEIMSILVPIKEQSLQIYDCTKKLLENYTSTNFKNLLAIAGGLCSGNLLYGLCKYSRNLIYDRFKVTIPADYIFSPELKWECEACPFKDWHYSEYNKKRLELTLIMGFARQDIEGNKDEVLKVVKEFHDMMESELVRVEKAINGQS